MKLLSVNGTIKGEGNIYEYLAYIIYLLCWYSCSFL